VNCIKFLKYLPTTLAGGRYMLRGIFVVLSLQLLLAPCAIAAPRVEKPAAGKPTRASESAKLSKAKSSAKGTPVTSINLPVKRKGNLTSETKYKVTQKHVQFEAAEINGEAVRPVVSSVASQKANQEFDLIPLRKRWHTEMIDSTTEY
jgi:hypothetical protein